jgi:hypothetical protein
MTRIIEAGTSKDGSTVWHQLVLLQVQRKDNVSFRFIDEIK